MILLVPRHSIGSRATIEVLDREGGDSVMMAVQVQPRASLAQLPGSTLLALGYRPSEEAAFELRDGSTRLLPVGDVRVRIGDITRSVTCAFDRQGGKPTLGMATLGELALEFRPDDEFIDIGADNGTER